MSSFLMKFDDAPVAACCLDEAAASEGKASRAVGLALLWAGEIH